MDDAPDDLSSVQVTDHHKTMVLARLLRGARQLRVERKATKDEINSLGAVAVKKTMHARAVQEVAQHIVEHSKAEYSTNSFGMKLEIDACVMSVFELRSLLSAAYEEGLKVK